MPEDIPNGISNAILQFVAKERWERKDISPGERIIEEGDIPDSIFQLVAGEARVYKIDKERGRFIEIAAIKSGDIFGEMSYFMNMPATATVIATAPCKVAILKKERLGALMQENARGACIFLQRVIEIICKRLALANIKIANLEALLAVYREYLDQDKFENWKKQEGQ